MRPRRRDRPGDQRAGLRRARRAVRAGCTRRRRRIPSRPVLERAMLVDAARIVQGALDVIAGVPPVPDHWYTVGIKSAAPSTRPAPASAKVALRSRRPAPAAPGDDEPMTMPFGDLTVSEGTVVKWLKAVGDQVKAGELIAEIETDKAVVEIEAPVSWDARPDRPAGRCGRADGRAHRRHQVITSSKQGNGMKILCANWQAADDAELERKHYPDIELILARSTNEKAAELDPGDLQDGRRGHQLFADAQRRGAALRLSEGADRGAFRRRFRQHRHRGWGARKIPACNVPDYGTTEVADHAIALMLALTRGTSSYAAAIAANGAEGWHFSKAPLIRRHKGATFGVIGLGRIGLAAARRAAAFDMKVVFYDPHLLSGVDLSTGYERVHSLAELMARSDVVKRSHAAQRRDAQAARRRGVRGRQARTGPRQHRARARSSISTRWRRRCASGTCRGRGARCPAERARRSRTSADRGLAQRRSLDRQPADRHPACGVLQPGLDGRPAAEVDRGGACLPRRGPADQLRQCGVS